MTREQPLGFQPPAIGEEEIEAVAETLRSGWLTTGPRAALLEERMAEYLEAKHVLAVASGTAAMHLALVALGIEAGDEVITTPITWPATANVIVHSGATPVFVDVREGDLNIDPALIEAAVNERTKAIMPVHLAGQPADLDPIWAASRRRPASASTRRRTSRRARAGSCRRTRTRWPTRSATCA
jgi:dTDP-4-amino-4,6-dideoxygalactose transaminase